MAETTGTTETYRGLTIQPKLDFGGKPFLINGKSVMEGFVVTGPSQWGTCNVMPGAAWFQTVAEARIGIDVLLDVGNGPAWWIETSARMEAAKEALA